MSEHAITGQWQTRNFTVTELSFWLEFWLVSITLDFGTWQKLHTIRWDIKKTEQLQKGQNDLMTWGFYWLVIRLQYWILIQKVIAKCDTNIQENLKIANLPLVKLQTSTCLRRGKEALSMVSTFQPLCFPFKRKNKPYFVRSVVWNPIYHTS